MTNHLHGVTNTVVLPTPATVIMAFGTDDVEFGEQNGSHVSARIKPQWDMILSMGHVTAKQFLLILAGHIKAIEDVSGEIKIPQPPKPEIPTKN